MSSTQFRVPGTQNTGTRYCAWCGQSPPPAGGHWPWCQAPQDETARIAAEHEAAFAALPEDEKNRQYARIEQGTAGAWLGTYTR